jgi:hypothetical protein
METSMDLIVDLVQPTSSETSAYTYFFVEPAGAGAAYIWGYSQAGFIINHTQLWPARTVRPREVWGGRALWT